MSSAPLRALALIAALLPATPAPAQTTHPVGTRDIALPNTTGQGTASLTARVHYPATVAGTNAPVLPRAGAWPVVVFLHGFAALGTLYPSLGDGLASAGYVAVLTNTAQFDNVTQELDGRAMFTALQAANANPGSPFAGALDLARAGLAGHSMGGGNVGNVLANNPGYRCGIALAPVTPRGNNAALVAVPLGIVVGTGDAIAPWQTYAQPFYLSLTGYRGLKFLYLMNGDCSHTNVVGLGAGSGTAAAVFQRALAVCRGFFARFLQGEADGLEAVIGVGARTEPRLVSLDVEIEQAEVWMAGPLRLATTSRLCIGAEPGLAGLLAASAFAPATPTPAGALLLEPATVFLMLVGVAGNERRLDVAIAVPNDPRLSGAQLPVQAVGVVRGGGLWLGAATLLTVQP